MWMCYIYFANSDRFTGFRTSLENAECVFVNGFPITWREQHSSTEQRHLLLGHLYAAKAFCQVKHGTHEVVTACGKREKDQQNTLSPNPLWCLKWLPPHSIMSPLTHQELWTAEELQTFHRRAACCWWGYKPGTYGSVGRACSLQTHTHLYIIYIYMLAKPLFCCLYGGSGQPH